MLLRCFKAPRPVSLRIFCSTQSSAPHYSTSSPISLAETPDHLTHLTPTGAARMVSMPPPSPSEVNPGAKHKPPTRRVAIARAIIRFSNPKLVQLIRSAAMEKGDVLAVARISGIMAAKKTSELIPLCHNIPLGGVQVDVEVVGSAGKAMGGTGNEETIGSLDEQSPPQESPKDRKTIDDAAPPGLMSIEKRAIEHGAVIITARVHTYGQTGVEMEALTAASVAGLTVYDMCKGVDRGMRMEAVRVVLKTGGHSGTWMETKNGTVESGIANS